MTTQPNIPITPVESSQIFGIGHDPASNTLAVQFRGKNGPGATYHYANVSPAQHAAFVNAKSIGTHFGQHFKAAPAHPFTRLPSAPPAVPPHQG